MASDINYQLQRLRSRRLGTDRLNNIAQDAQDLITSKSLLREKWESRASGKPYTQYALGAMQAVDSDYTRISLETGKRVENQLNTRLNAVGASVEFRLQGSVPLDVHIRGVSDVDLLTIGTHFLVYTPGGVKAIAGYYTASPNSPVDVLERLRYEVEQALPSAFPAAKVDVSGDKAVKISGGSLARPVDVIPSHWWDTATYQASGQESDRGIYVLNKSTRKTIENFPFLHIKLIGDRCDLLLGGLRKAIRLCKNIKADAQEDGEVINLSSFDIASTMYHADQAALRLGSVYELSILGETQRHLDQLSVDNEYAKTLRVPDNSRFIFDSNEKLIALRRLSIKFDQLIKQVASEQNTLLTRSSNTTLEDNRLAIKNAFY
jgi:hypothetical protein